MLWDSHFHYDFLEEEERKAFLEALRSYDVGIVAQSVLPSAFLSLRQTERAYCHTEQIYYALGFHPWWMRSLEQMAEELSIFKKALSQTRWIGEVGLDFSEKISEKTPIEIQKECFRNLLLLCQREAEERMNRRKEEKGIAYPLILSIHAVHATREVLDLWEEIVPEGGGMIPILHRFHGEDKDRKRNLENGGYFSIHRSMLRSKRGRHHIKGIPLDRLLLESDLPRQKEQTVRKEKEKLPLHSHGAEMAKFLCYELSETQRELFYLLKQAYPALTYERMQEQIFENFQNLKNGEESL